MQPIYMYVIFYIVPIFLLIALSTYVLVHNSRAIENRLIFISLISFCFTLFGEFARHILPFKWNPFISMYVVGFSTMAAMATIFCLVSTIVRKHCHHQMPFFIPFLGYSIIPFHFLIISLGLRVSTDDFQKVGFWIYRTDSLYNIWLYGTVGMAATLTFYLCLYGWYNSKTTAGKQLFRFLSISSICVCLSFVFTMSSLNINNMPPNPTLFIIFITSILLAIGVTQFKLTPSIEARYQTLFELTPTSIIVLNEHFEIIEMNKQAKKFFHKEGTELITFLHTRFNTKQGIKMVHKLKKEKQLTHYPLEFEHPITLQKVTLLFDATLVSFQNSENYYIIWRDVTAEIKQKQLVHKLAYHDALTGLKNRASFVGIVQQILAEKSELMHAFVLIDLNFFKQINDTYGHIVGDEVLKFVANLLQEATPSNTIVARLGGDEFVIFYENLQDEEELVCSIQTIREHFAENLFHYENWSQPISLSIGYSLYPADGTDFEILFHQADMSMYTNKTAIKRHMTTSTSDRDISSKVSHHIKTE